MRPRNGFATKRSIRGAVATFGYSLIELMIAIAIVGILGTMAVNGYQSEMRKAKRVMAAADIAVIQAKIIRFFSEKIRLPKSLAEIHLADMQDPWGSAYVYTNFIGLKGAGGKRKDKNLVPINSDYDLYSKGPDKKSRSPLTAKASRDDIIRANNGRFIGLAEDY